RIAKDAVAQRLGELDKADDALDDLEEKTRRASEVADARIAERADPRLRAMLQEDLGRSRALAEKANDLVSRMDAAAEKLTDRAVATEIEDLRRVIDKAELGKVDAVIGEKRKLEIEVEDLAQGRYPPEFYNKLYEQGDIADDEEYWPPE